MLAYLVLDQGGTLWTQPSNCVLSFRISAIVFYRSSMNHGMCPHCPLIVLLCIWYAVCLSLMAVNETNFEIDKMFISYFYLTSECTVVKVQSVGILSAASMHGQSSITAFT